nr:hypothetical protein [Cytophagales bacterium]
MTTTLDVAAFTSAILYPLALIIIFLLFRKDIPEIVKGIAGRLTKLEVAGISLELAKAESFDPHWQKEGTIDLRHRAAAVNVNDSTAGNFLSQLKAGGIADYAIVDLGNGGEWLSSRLFIMAIIFDKMKSVNGIVFLESTSSTRKKLVGWAESKKVRWAFAQRFPWMETAYAEAYSNTIPNASVVSYQGKLGFVWDNANPSPSIDLLQKFLLKIQAPGGFPPPPEENDWVPLTSDATIQEHACWLNAELVEGILGDALITEHIKSDIDDSTKEQQLKRYLKLGHPFIALVKDNERFDYLVKREKLLEQLL